MSKIEDDLIDIFEAADLLRVTPITVRFWINSDWIPAIRIGPKLIRVYKIDVLALSKKIHSVEAPRGSLIARSFSYPSRL